MTHIKSAKSCDNPVTLPQNSKQQTTHIISCATVDACIQRYNAAKERLLEVNHWHQFSGSLSANFTLTDSNGHILHHKAQEGDHIRIDMPGPGSRTNKGYDWVEIEKIEDRSTPSGNCAYTAIRVRPSGMFYQPGARAGRHGDVTSSFVIERVGSNLRASVYGPDDKPGTPQVSLLDKLRSWLMTALPLPTGIGISGPRWKLLVKGWVK